MFKKFVSLFRSQPPVDPEIAASVGKATEMGREIGRQFNDQVSAYIDLRCSQIEPAFLRVFQKTLDNARYQEEHSPLMLARIEYDLFIENVDESTEKLITETKAAHSEWNDLHATIGVTDDIDKLLRTLIGAKSEDFKLVGLKLLLENADIIKRADEDWRIKFPVLSAAEPPV